MLTDDERTALFECCKASARYALQLRAQMTGIEDEHIALLATRAMMQQLDEAMCEPTVASDTNRKKDSDADR